MRELKYKPILMFIVIFAVVTIFPPNRIGSMGNKGAGYVNISIDRFVEMMDQKDFVLINVHVPYEGEIPGTDLFIPYHSVKQNREKLPEAKDARIVVYCRTGPMGDTAAAKLTEMGYTQVFHLKDGMERWKESGRELKFGQ